MLLALETATAVCSVALVDDRRVLDVAETLEPRSHASRLVPLIQELLRDRDLTPADLAAVAVSSGPGSYTGLRIGASTAKGVAWAHDLALIAVPSLDALAEQARPELADREGLVTAFDSRRGEVYASFFVCNNGTMQPHTEAAAVALDELDAWLPEHDGALWVAGEAGGAVVDALTRSSRLLDPDRVRPSAGAVGWLGWARWQAGDTEAVAAFEPAYLNAFVAKRGRSIFERLPR